MMEWRKVKIGEIGRVVTGKTPRTAIEENYGGDIPFLTPSDDLSEKHISVTKKTLTDTGVREVKNCLIPTRSICVTCIGSDLGKVVMNNKPLVTNQQINCIIPNEETDADYIYYLMTIVGKELNHLSKTSTAIPIINKSTFETFSVCIPPLPTQRRIAAILSSLDAQIENNNRINRNLEAQAQALFKSWFVDFEPWGGKMPEGWREGKLGEIAQLLNGFAFKSDSFIEDGKYQLITIKGVQDGALTTDGAVKINDIPSKMPTWCLLEKGDILLSLTGNVGRCCYVDRDNLLLNQRVAKIQPLQEYNRMFVYTLFRTETMKSRLISLSRGTAQANLSPIETSHLEILIPSKEVLKCFGEKSNSILNQMINNTEANLRLASLRDTLLPKLMKGEIEV